MGKIAWCLLFACVLGPIAACGGSTGGIDPLFDAVNQLDQPVVERTEFNFVHDNLSPYEYAAGQRVEISTQFKDVAEIRVLLPTGTDVSSWMRMEIFPSSRNPLRYSLSFAPRSDAPAGNYSTPMRVALFRSDNTQIAHSDIQVSYRLFPRFWLPGQLASLLLNHGEDRTPFPFYFTSDSPRWSAKSSAPWLKLTPEQGSEGQLQMSIEPPAGGLPEGNSKATIEITDFDGRRITQEVTASVRTLKFSVEPTSITFNQTMGSPTPQPAYAQLNNNLHLTEPWTAESDSAWLIVEPAQGEGPFGPSIRIAGDSPVPSGNTQGNVFITATNRGRPVRMSIPVTRVVTPPEIEALQDGYAIYGAREPIDFSVTSGKSSIGNLRVGGGVFPNGPFWTRRSGPPWMTFGQFSEPPASAYSDPTPPIAIAPNWDLLSPGIHTGSVRYDLTIGNETFVRDIPVRLDLQPGGLVAASPGIAFSATPSFRQLAHTVEIRDDIGMPAAWNATSDKAWLSAASAGATGAPLSISANPAGLAAETLHEAVVTVSAPGRPNWAVERIRVGLWISNNDAPPIRSIPGNFVGLAVDPVRPHVYLSDGTDLFVHHLHTGARIATVAGRGAMTRSMAVSSDGTRLFGGSGDQWSSDVIRIALPALTDVSLGQHGAMPDNNFDPIVLTRIRGRSVVFTGGSQPMDADTMQPLLYSNYVFGPIAFDRRRASALSVHYDFGDGQVRLRRYVADLVNVFGVDSVRMETMAALPYSFVNGTNLDLAVSADGTRAFVTALGSECRHYRMTDLASLNAMSVTGNANNVEVANDGRVLCAGATANGVSDVGIYTPGGSLLNSLRVAPVGYSIRTRKLAVSSDSQMIVAITDEPAVRIVRMPSNGTAGGLLSTKQISAGRPKVFTDVLLRRNVE